MSAETSLPKKGDNAIINEGEYLTLKIGKVQNVDAGSIEYNGENVSFEFKDENLVQRQDQIAFNQQQGQTAFNQQQGHSMLNQQPSQSMLNQQQSQSMLIQQNCPMFSQSHALTDFFHQQIQMSVINRPINQPLTNYLSLNQPSFNHPSLNQYFNYKVTQNVSFRPFNIRAFDQNANRQLVIRKKIKRKQI